jgi:hypothetical protein
MVDVVLESSDASWAAVSTTRRSRDGIQRSTGNDDEGATRRKM